MKPYLIAIVIMLASSTSLMAQSLVTNNRLVLGVESNKSASVRLGDMDGDGDLDAVVANGRHWPQQNFLVLNQGAGRFTTVRPLGVERNTTYACEPVDLDGDGDLDIVTGNDTAPGKIYLNDGTGHFKLKGDFGIVSSVRSLTAADLDGDSDIDILVTCRGRSNWIYLNDGAANFQKGIKFGTERDSTIAVAVADVNRDGLQDLVLANRDSQMSAWLLNEGKLKFSKPLVFGDAGSQSRAVVTGDFDRDGNIDWATGNIRQPNQLFFGDGKGGVKRKLKFGSDGGRTYSLDAVDLDGDGDLDLVAGNVGQRNAVFFNQGKGEKFRSESFGSPTGATYGVDAGDLNGDGRADVVTSNSDGMNKVFINALKSNNKKAESKSQPPARVEKSKIDSAPNLSADWPEFRGAGHRGVAEGHALPANWSAEPSEEQETKNVLWQTEIPGLGHSSPVIAGEHLFLLTAVAKSTKGGKADLAIQSGGKPTAADDNGTQDWLLLCYDKNDGSELWRRVVHQGKPRATRHAKATHANTSVTVAGNRIVAFLGSEGIHCFDSKGNLIWKRDLGVINISKYGIGWGFSSSPAVSKDRIAVVCDDPSNPFTAVLRLSDGEEVWRTSRKDICERSWGTPLIHSHGDKSQVVINGWPWIVAYDFSDGKELWRLKGGGDNPVPTPFESGGFLYLTNAHGGPSPIYVVRPDARGDITPVSSERSETQKEPVVWSVDRGGSYMSTPVVYNKRLYVATAKGVVRCFNSETGERVFEKRLGRKAGIIASVVAGDGKVYLASENGSVYVLADGPEYKLLSENPMGEPCLASPAISEGTLFIRTTSRLVAVKQDK